MASKIASRISRLVVAALAMLVSVLISLEGVNAIEDLEFTQKPSDTVVLRNQELTLGCAVSGLPPLTVQWLLNGQVIRPTDDRQILSAGSLFIPIALPKRDSGEYQCCVSNKVGRICSCPARVTVSNVPRYSIAKLPDVVQRGGVFRMECLSEGALPVSEVMWRLGKDVIAPDERRTILPSGVLQVTEVSAADAGNYRCFTEHTSDRRFKSPAMGVVVLEPPATDAGSRDPVIVAGPQSQRVKEWESALFECLADGDSLQITWNRADGEPIREQGVNRIGRGNLQLLGVTPEDEGLYNCTVENTATGVTAQAQAQLVVTVPPTFSAVPEEFFGPLGSTARFSCEATGKPTPTIHWLHNGNPTGHNDRAIQRADNDLLFLRTLKDDIGVVQCIAKNEAGSAQAGAKLLIRIVENSLDPPQNINLVSINPSTVMVTWEPPVEKRELTVLAYTIHYEAYEAHGPNLELQQALEGEDTNVFIADLSPHTNYSFYMVTWTKLGPSNRSKVYYILTDESRPSVAPDFSLASNTPTSITVKWQPLPMEYRQGVIVSYLITVRETDMTMDTVIEDVSVREYTVEGLLAGQIYQVRMAAATDKGLGANSAWVTMQTRVDGDSRPQAPHFEILRLNLTSVSVRPAPQQPSDMNLLGLKLYYYKDTGELGVPTDPIYLPLNTTEYVITGLEPDTTYSIRLLAYTVFSDGLDTILDITTEPKPGAHSQQSLLTPTSVVSEALGPRIIKLTWHAPISVDLITGYTVRYWPRNNRSKTVQPIQVALIQNSTVNELIVSGLDPFTSYEFDICSVGAKMFCSTIVVKTQEDRPSTPPEDILAMPLDPHAVELQWQPPMVPNGIITHYVILYDEDVNKPEEKWNQQARNGTAHHSTVDGLASDTRYYFKVRAGTQVGEGPPTNAVAAQTLTAKESGAVSWPWQEGILIGVCLAFILIVTLIFFIICKKRGILKTASASPTTPVHSNGSAVCTGYMPNGSSDGRTYVMGSLEKKEQNGFSPMISALPQPKNLDTKGGTPLIINGNGPVRHHPHHHHFPNGGGGMVIPSLFPRSSGPCSGDPDASSLALLPGSESVTNSDLGEDNSQGKSEASSSSGGFPPFSQDLNHRTSAMQQCCRTSKLPQCSSCCLGPCTQLSDSSTGSYGEPVIPPASKANRKPASPSGPALSLPQGRRAAAARPGVNISCSNGDCHSPDGKPTLGASSRNELTWPRHTRHVYDRDRGYASGGESSPAVPSVWEKKATSGCEESPSEQSPLRGEDSMVPEDELSGGDTSPYFLTKVLDELSSGSCSTAV